jgi:L-methionine (R)-S-oxide reductase
VNTDEYDAVERDIRHQVDVASTPLDAMTRTVRVLKTRIPSYTWVGIYLVEGADLLLGPYLGTPSPHTRIPIGRGICGAVATLKSTIVVDDVSKDPRYLACSVDTKSEIVVPVLRGQEVVGEIDIDSNSLAAFGARDMRMLEAVAAMLAEKMAEKA